MCKVVNIEKPESIANFKLQSKNSNQVAERWQCEIKFVLGVKCAKSSMLKNKKVLQTLSCNQKTLIKLWKGGNVK